MPDAPELLPEDVLDPELVLPDVEPVPEPDPVVVPVVLVPVVLVPEVPVVPVVLVFAVLADDVLAVAPAKKESVC